MRTMGTTYDLNIRGGDSGRIESEIGLQVVITKDGAPEDLSGDTILFIVEREDTREQVLQKSSSDSGSGLEVVPSEGRISVSFTPDETRLLENQYRKKLYYGLVRSRGSDYRRTILDGSVNVYHGVIQK